VVTKKQVRATPESGADRLSDILDRASGIDSGLPNETHDVEEAGQDVGENGSLGGVSFAEPGGVFDAAAGLVGVTTFGIALAAHTQFPGGRIDLEVASKTNITIGKREIDSDDTTQGAFRVSIRASSDCRIHVWKFVLGVERDVRCGVVEAALTTDPLAVASLIVVTVEGESVAIRTNGVALSIVFSSQTGERVIVFGVTTGNDDPQRLQIVVDVA